MSNIPALQNIPDVSFIDNLTLEQLRNELIKDYTDRMHSITGQGVELSQADPVRLLLDAFAQQFYQALQYIDWAGKKNLLKYSYGEALDNLAANKGLTRNPAGYATTTLRFSLQNVRTSATGIPGGTRVSNLAGVYFATSSYAEIPAGQQEVSVEAIALEAGEVSNGIPIGSLSQIVDPAPYIFAVENTTITAGGTDTESDDSLTERTYLFPASYSTAGAEAAYIYWAKTFRSDISDVVVYSPEPSEAAVLFMLESGLPSEEDIAHMQEHLRADTIRPLTDRVTVSAPTTVSYNLNLTYYINSADAPRAVSIQTAVTRAINEYKTWQRAIGRDINPSELIHRIMAAGAKRVAITSPAYTELDRDCVAILEAESIVYGGLEEG